MKRFYFIVHVAVFSLIMTMSCAQAEPIIDTEKSMYNLDPYYWVYSASQYTYFGTNPNLWPAEGHDKTIRFSLEGYTASVPPLTFSVSGLEGDPVEGSLTEDNGIYRGEFVVGEANVGAELFKPGLTDMVGTPLVPRVVTLTISDNAGTVTIAEREISVSRWACDRCHVEKNLAKSIYSWSNATGTSIAGPHTWPNILGRNGGRPGFTYENLTNDALTHTPTVGAWVPNSDGVLVWVPNPLDNPIGHEMTIVKGGGLPGCSPCHQGSGNVRHAYSGVEGMRFIVSRVRSMTVKCVFCHSADAGYIPEDLKTNKPHWENWIMQGWN